MDKQLSSNRDATDDSGGGGGNQQKRRRDGQSSNNMRPHNNCNFNGNQQGWNDNNRRDERRDYGGRGGGTGRGPPGRGFSRGRGNMRGPQNNMRGTNDMRDHNNMNGPPQYQQQHGRGGRGGNMPQHQQQHNQGYAQQQQLRYDGQQQGRGFQGRGDTNTTAGRGRGRGDMPGRGSRTQQQPTQTDIQKSQTPIPPSERRTLILSNIPSTLKYHQIQNHLMSVFNVQVQYCTIDHNTKEAYVRFKYVNDAMKVWDSGTKGLDGNNTSLKNNGGSNNNGDEEKISLVQLGVQLKAVHYTNFMIAQPKVADRGQQSNGGNGRGSASMSGGGRGGGEGRGFDRKRNWDQQQGQSNGGQYDTPQSSAAATASPAQSTPNYPTNTKYHRSPSKQQSQQKLSPMEKQLQEQKQLEEQKAYEQFQIQEKEWRKRRKAEYDIFMTAKQSREAHLSTLEHKKDLLSKQESMLNSQLPLHKKMLTVLKSKNAELSEQSKKMKEILSTQTRVMEIKKEIKVLVETIEKLKEEEVTKGVFRPTEKRPIFSSADTDGGSAKKKKARLDRRTTVLKVDGFNSDVTEDAIKEHFKCCTSVNIETKDEKTFAIVNFANRVHAEKAKSSMTKFNNQELTCTWHNLPSAASTEAVGSVPSNQDQTALKNGDGSTDQTAKDDEMNVDEEEGLYDDFGGDVFDIEPPPDGNVEEAVDYDDEDEDLVDYD